MGIYIGLDNNRSGGLAIGGGRRGKKQPMAEFESVFTFDSVPTGVVDGKGKLKNVKGNSLVWNQVLDKANTRVYFGQVWGAAGGSRVTRDNGVAIDGPLMPAGHKFLVKTSLYIRRVQSVEVVASIAYADLVTYFGGDNQVKAVILTQSNNYGKLHISVQTGLGDTGDAMTQEIYDNASIIVIDLTLMFGAGNEPTTVAEFEKLFPLPYYDYNAGEIISNKTEEVKVVGFNQWFGITSYTGAGYTNTVNDAASVEAIKTIFRLLKWGYDLYYCLTVTGTQQQGGAPIGRMSAFKGGTLFATILPNRVLSASSYQSVDASAIESITSIVLYGSTTGFSISDICINLSDTARNGQYEPYKTNTIALNLPTLTGKLNGEGESVVVFPEGMKNVGSTYDEAQGSTAIKKIGKRAYQSGDESDTSVVTDGTNTLYVLATPETYTLDTPLPVPFQAYKGGTMMQLPQNGSEPTTAPMVMVADWPVQSN